MGDNVNVLMQMVRACQGMTVVMPDERMKHFGGGKKEAFRGDPKPDNLRAGYLALPVLS